MSMYKFLDSNEQMVRVNLNSYTEAKQYATEHNLKSLALEYYDFVNAFKEKIDKCINHGEYNWLKLQAEKAINSNLAGCGIESITANDFMKRVITMPMNYIIDWLDGNNNLEWLEDYK